MQQMPNLHTPERQPGETQKQYRARQAASREAVAQSRQPTQAPATNNLDVSRFWLGQHSADAARRERRAAIKAVGRRQYLKSTKDAGYKRSTGAA